MTDRQRLAIVMGKCFTTVTPATRNSLRHAALSQRLGREITTSADLTDYEVRYMIQGWEHHQAPFSPSDKAITEVNALAKQYQHEHGQSELSGTPAPETIDERQARQVAERKARGRSEWTETV